MMGIKSLLKKTQTFTRVNESSTLYVDVALAIERYYDGQSFTTGDVFPAIGFEEEHSSFGMCRNLTDNIEIFEHKDKVVVKIWNRRPGFLIGRLGKDITGFTQYLKMCLKNSNIVVEISESFDIVDRLFHGKSRPLTLDDTIIIQNFNGKIKDDDKYWGELSAKGQPIEFLKTIVGAK
jgi:hypothetical protein